MVIYRVPGPPTLISPLPTGETIYQVRLSAVPTPAWRAVFYRPPGHLTTPRYQPDHVDIHEMGIIFRTDPAQLETSLRWIDHWIAMRASVVKV